MSPNKLKVRELTSIEKERILEFITRKRLNFNLIISVILLFIFLPIIYRSIFIQNDPLTLTVIIYYIVLLMIAFLPFSISYFKKQIRIYRIKTNNVKGVKAMCPYGRYYGNFRKKVNGHPVYEIITEFESKQIIEPNIYGPSIKENDNFYVIRFGKKDTVFCNFDFKQE